MITIIRSFSRKKNLGNYETADFFASFEEECEPKDAEQKSKELFLLAKNNVENDLKDLQLKNVSMNLETKLKIAKNELAIMRRNKKTDKINELKFEISLIKDMMKDVEKI